jgi:hypothetical protein
VRALFGGGTLALMAVAGHQLVCDPLFTNVPLRPEQRLGDPRRSEGHCVVDLGADELTAGRPHPMLEPAILVERLLAEAADPEVALVLFDLVLGDGAHPDPAAIIRLRHAPTPTHTATPRLVGEPRPPSRCAGTMHGRASGAPLLGWAPSSASHPLVESFGLRPCQRRF